MLKLSLLLQISYKQTCHDNECDFWSKIDRISLHGQDNINKTQLVSFIYGRFGNYMDKCSGGQSYLTVDRQGKVSLRSLNLLESLAEADWKSINPPTKFNHREFRFWLSHSTGQCLCLEARQVNELWVQLSARWMAQTPISSLHSASIITKPFVVVDFTTSNFLAIESQYQFQS